MKPDTLNIQAKQLLSSYTNKIEAIMLGGLSNNSRYGFAIMEPYIPGVGMARYIAEDTYGIDDREAMTGVNYTDAILENQLEKYVALSAESALEMAISHAINTAVYDDLGAMHGRNMYEAEVKVNSTILGKNLHEIAVSFWKKENFRVTRTFVVYIFNLVDLASM